MNEWLGVLIVWPVLGGQLILMWWCQAILRDLLQGWRRRATAEIQAGTPITLRTRGGAVYEGNVFDMETRMDGPGGAPQLIMNLVQIPDGMEAGDGR